MLVGMKTALYAMHLVMYDLKLFSICQRPSAAGHQPLKYH